MTREQRLAALVQFVVDDITDRVADMGSDGLDLDLPPEWDAWLEEARAALSVKE